MEQIALLKEIIVTNLQRPMEHRDEKGAVQRALQKMTPDDDVEAFLTMFERVAEREKLPATDWADVIAPYLTGEPQKAYYDLCQQDVQDYDKLKAEILARLGVTTAVRAWRVRTWSYHMDKPARSQMYDLIHLVKKWLEPDTCTPAKMVEKVVLDRFTRALPPALQRRVGHGDPIDANQLVSLLERYLATEVELCDDPIARRPRNPRWRAPPGKTVPLFESRGKRACDGFSR
ncbi:SCAN domain-containing protein 3-like [Leptodactylus fuscus]